MLKGFGKAINGNRHLQMDDVPPLTDEQMLLACKALFFHEFRGVEDSIASKRHSVLHPKKYGGDGHRQLRAKCDSVEGLLKAASMFGAIRAEKIRAMGPGAKCVYLIVIPLHLFPATEAEKKKARTFNLWYLEEWSYPCTLEAAEEEAADEARRIMQGGQG